MTKFNLFEDLTPWLFLDRPGIKGNPHFSHGYGRLVRSEAVPARTIGKAMARAGPDIRRRGGVGKRRQRISFRRAW